VILLHVLLNSVGEFGVNHDASAVLAHNHFLVRLDFNLFLRWNTVEAAAAGVAVYNHYAEAVVGFVADALECCESAFVDFRLKLFGFAEKCLLFRAGFAYELVEVGFLLFEQVGLVGDAALGVCNFGIEICYLAFVFAYVLLA